MNNFKHSFHLIIILVITSCHSVTDRTQIGKIRIEWELITNNHSAREGALARFNIYNDSRLKLTSSNWVLFFNMAPRDIISAGDTSMTDLMHINGDWYKLVPRNDFLLSPGKMQTVWYQFEGCNIKESDAPTGLYLVIYDDEGQETEVIPISDYTIEAFTRGEQLVCSYVDFGQLNTHQRRYREYQDNTTSDSSELQSVIPSPRYILVEDTAFSLDKTWSLSYESELESEAAFLKNKLNDLAGFSLSSAENNRNQSPVIQLSIANIKIEGDSSESYRLSINDTLILIEGSKTGVFYGIQSLLQLIPYEAYPEKKGHIKLKKTYIEDAPRFGYRGQHIDVCRNFQSKAQLLKIIDLMAMYKLNRLHLYLTEDEAWRLQIKGLPELTEIGSHRGHTNTGTDCLPPAYGSGPFSISDHNYGSGYYTREDYKEIIRYAHERHIQVIPSINFPGHARAAIKAMEVRYQGFMAEGKESEADEYRLIDPEDYSVYRSAQYYNDNVVCVARESVYHFFETVIDDILAMHREAEVPIDMIHTGGDEVPEGVWSVSPLCDTLMKQLAVFKDPRNLQNYFFNRIISLLAERNLNTGGWEEVVLTKDANQAYQVNPGFDKTHVIPYIWNNLSGSEDLGYRIANAGYPVVLCPVTNFYFDLAYSSDPQEPGLYWGGFNDEKDAWMFAPYSMIAKTAVSGTKNLSDRKEKPEQLVKLKLEARKNILGLQAQLWHETIRGGEMMEYYLLPKIIAFAERCWASPAEWETGDDSINSSEIFDAEWRKFSNTLYAEELPKLSYVNGGYTYRIPPPGAIIEDGYMKANAISPELIIRYTTDGSDPQKDSEVYRDPIKIVNPIRLKAFNRTGHSSRVIEIKE